jgi:malate synthase
MRASSPAIQARRGAEDDPARQQRPACRDRRRPRPSYRQDRSGRRRRRRHGGRVSTIIDMEDSVAAVDAQDKTLVYRNWLGLMKGDLSADFEKGGKIIERRLNPDRRLCGARWRRTAPARPQPHAHPQRRPAHVHGRGSRRVRRRDAGRPARRRRERAHRQTRPRRQGQAAQFAHRLGLHREAEDARARGSGFAERAVRARRGHARPAAPHAQDGHHGRGAPHDGQPRRLHPRAKERVVFINTGFLDRTGDEIHTSMEAGPMVRKNDMRASRGSRPTRTTTSRSGLAAGPARPRRRSARACGPRPTAWPTCWSRRSAIRAGANTAWVPSPTAAALHALHYHQVDVFAVQKELAAARPALRHSDHARSQSNFAPEEVQQELDNNARASSATSCAGSTRASAAPRCRTFTMSA